MGTVESCFGPGRINIKFWKFEKVQITQAKFGPKVQMYKNNS